MEFKKMIAEMKNYKMNFISGVIYNLIILAGLFGLLTWNGGLVFSEWFLFYFFLSFSFSNFRNCLPIGSRNSNRPFNQFNLV